MKKTENFMHWKPGGDLERGKNGGAAYGGGLTARRQRINSKVLEERVDRGLAEALNDRTR